MILSRHISIGLRTRSFLGCLGLVSIATLAASAASALSVDTALTCPEPVPPPRVAGTTTPIHVRIENSECVPVDVRLSSMVTGNLNQSVGGTTIVGPKVAAANITVPAGNCAFPPVPGVYEDDLEAPPLIPLSFAGKIGVLVLITEWSNGSETETCVLPEPTLHAQLCAGVLGLLILSCLGAPRGRSRSEKRT